MLTDFIFFTEHRGRGSNHTSRTCTAPKITMSINLNSFYNNLSLKVNAIASKLSLNNFLKAVDIISANGLHSRPTLWHMGTCINTNIQL